MKVRDILVEANIAGKVLQDPKLTKMLAIAMRHDSTIPRQDIARLGPKPTDKDIATLWGNLVDAVLANSNFGDLSKDGKLDAWIIKMYVNHLIDFEDLTGEAVDALGAWKSLSIRGLLQPQDQDLNNFTKLDILQKRLRIGAYTEMIKKIKQAEMLEKHKREKKEVVLIDNDRFLVFVPMNYGSCYTFNFQTGHQSTYCTGGSDGLRWFQRYGSEGPVVSIIDKANVNNKNGKWQMHAPTDQLKNSEQDQYGAKAGDREFHIRFPGLMVEIIKAMKIKAPELAAASKAIVPPNGYNIADAIQDIVNKFPLSAKGKRPTKQEVLALQQADAKDAADDAMRDQLRRDRQQPAAQPAQAAQAAQPEPQVNNEPANWSLHVGQRIYPGFLIQNATPAQALQALQQVVKAKKLPPGRAWLTSDGNDNRVVRVR